MKEAKTILIEVHLQQTEVEVFTRYCSICCVLIEDLHFHCHILQPYKFSVCSRGEVIQRSYFNKVDRQKDHSRSVSTGKTSCEWCLHYEYFPSLNSHIESAIGMPSPRGHSVCLHLNVLERLGGASNPKAQREK